MLPLLDGWLKPGQPASEGVAGADWRPYCDRDGVPPTLYVAANRGLAADAAVIHAFVEGALTYPGSDRVWGAAELPDGSVARDSAGAWEVPPPPPGNTTQITWLDDTFMCTAILSHAARSLQNRSLLVVAARRLSAVYASRQRDRVDGLLYHGFDVATGNHSCCKWGDGNGWGAHLLPPLAKDVIALMFSTVCADGTSSAPTCADGCSWQWQTRSAQPGRST